MYIQNIYDLVISGKNKNINAAIEAALKDGCDASSLLNAMISAMDEVGEQFDSGEIFVPEMLLSAKTMKKGLSVLGPFLGENADGISGKAIIGTVAGDLHDIGKSLVAMMLESSGFQVIDLGEDVPAESFLLAYEKHPDTKIIACSALLTTTLPAMESTVAAINAALWRSQVKVMVGGGPVTQEFADRIGADAYSSNAAAAAKIAKSFV